MSGKGIRKCGFLLLAFFLLVCMNACSCRPQPKREKLKVDKVITTEVLIVGAGGTGLAAAAAASENGADVIVLEKLAFVGGSTMLSGGGISATNTKFQRAEGIEDSKESWMELWKERQATSNPEGMYPDYEFVGMFMDEAVITTEWLADTIGQKYASIEGFGVDPVRRIHFPKKAGQEIIQNLEEYVKEKGVEIITETPAKELIVDNKGDVTGVIAEGKEGKIAIEAQKVILATGGFAQNEGLLERFASEAAGTSELTMAGVGSTGEGILMAEDIDAGLYEEPWIMGVGIATRIKDTAMLGMDWTKLYVNGGGERFANEQMHYAIATNKIMEQDEAWIVMDSAAANADIIAALEEARPSDEVVVADTFAELAEGMDVSVDTFTATMEEYNAGAHSGNDALGKEAEYLIAVEVPPYYAVKAYPQTMGTFGGVKTDENFRVLRADGSVIKNLYAGGECANKIIFNQVYMSGGSVQFALTSGRIAGEHAARNL